MKNFIKENLSEVWRAFCEVFGGAVHPPINWSDDVERRVALKQNEIDALVLKKRDELRAWLAKFLAGGVVLVVTYSGVKTFVEGGVQASFSLGMIINFLIGLASLFVSNVLVIVRTKLSRRGQLERERGVSWSSPPEIITVFINLSDFLAFWALILGILLILDLVVFWGS